MFYVLQNESTAARRRVPILLTDAATGSTAQTGVATTTIFPYVNINGGAFAGGAGTIAEAGFGQYYYEFDVAEIATLGLAGIHITAAGCRDYDAISQVAALNVYSASVGASAYDVWNYASGRTITGGIADTVTTLTDRSGFAITGGTITTVSDKTGYSLSGSQTFNLTGNITGNLSGSVGSVTGAVGSVTGNIGGNVVGSVGSVVGNVGGNVVGSVASVTSDVNVSTASMSGIAGTVWSYASRTITGGIADTVTTLTNRSGFAITGGTITTVSDKTGYSLSSPQAFDLTGNITGNLSGSVGSVTNAVTFDSAQYASIASSVWNAGTRTITGGIADTVTTLTDRSGFAITGGTITTVSDKTGYSLSGTQAFNLTGDITGNLSGSVGSVSGSVGSVTADVNVSTASMSGIAGTVWNTDVSAFTSPSAGFDVHNGAAGAGISAYNVWNFVLSNSDTAEVNLVAASAGGGGITAGAVANAVWNSQLATYATPGTGEVFSTDTYGTKIARTIIKDRPAAIDTSQRITSVVSALNANVITATSIQAAAITEAKFGTDAISSRVIAADAITSAELAPSANTEIADAVWAYATRSITSGTITTNNDKTGYSLSGSQTFDVTGNITGNLSGSVGSVTTVSSGAISASSFLAGAVDAAAVANDAVTEIAGGVWSYVTRDITGGTITTVSDKTGYSLSGTQSFNLTGNITGNLSGSVGSVSGAVGSVTGAVGSVTGAVGSVTGAVGSVTSPVSISTASMSGIAGTVWNTDISSFTNPSAGYSLAVAGAGGVSAADVWNYNGGRTITGGTATTVTNPVSVSTASMTGIAGTVWSYSPRTLTSGGFSAADVWNYNISGITTAGTAGDQLNDAATGSATNIINGPYFVKSNVDSQDGTLDVIRDMVQSIQLTVTDVNLNPFDTTALTLAVNFYDQAGSLTTSYGTTELYGPAGLIQFTLDTAVTANEGRYNLILSAAGAGNTIKFGPLQTLVRPF